MAQVVKKKPDTRQVVREGAAEVGEKLRSDFSRWARVRRVVSLKPMVGCMACDAAGKYACEACGGTGRSKAHFQDDEPMPCPHCGGAGHVTCVECAGAGEIVNVHRKQFLWVLVIGVLAWAFILFQLWGRDFLPEQRAKLLQRGEHGQSAAPGAGGLQGGGVSVPSGGGMAAPGAGMVPGSPGMAPPAGGMSPQPGMPGAGRPLGGGVSMPGPGGAPAGGGVSMPAQGGAPMGGPTGYAPPR